MKKLVLILLLLRSLSAAAQISISDFRQSSLDEASSIAVHTDPDGFPCSVLKLSTKQKGWTFDTGLAGIMYTQYTDGAIWLYVPASARHITIAHYEFGTLREWRFPVTLRPGYTYTMTLSYKNTNKAPGAVRDPHMQKPCPPANTACSPALQSSTPLPETSSSLISTKNGKKEFCTHFADLYLGFSCSKNSDNYYETDDRYLLGFSYTWVGKRIGPYISVATDLDEGGSIVGGMAIRLTGSEKTGLDWQVYCGVGLMNETFGLDAGARFAWRSSHKLSRWDFGFGCQFTRGTITPTVSLGLYIWGIPTLIGIGLLTYSL